MSLSSETMIKLMAYADGELDESDRPSVEALLAKDGEAKKIVLQMQGLGNVVAALHDDRQKASIAAFDIADVIMAKVEEAPAPSKRGEIAGGAAGRGIRPNVSSLDVARAKRASQMKVAGGIAAALALAAAVFLVARDKETPMGGGGGAKPTTAMNAPADGPGVEVEAVQSEGNSVSVYYLPSSKGLSTSVVVWVDETGEK